MATIKIVGFTEMVKSVEEWAEAVGKWQRERLEPLINQFVDDSQRDAERFLNRPNWLLSRAIGKKTKKYNDGRVLWGMTGFVELPGGEPRRNPGFYGKYHESGYVEPMSKPKPQLVKKNRVTSDGKKQIRTVALHFLKRAEMKNQPDLAAAVDEVNEKIFAELGNRLGRRRLRVKVGGLKKW